METMLHSIGFEVPRGSKVLVKPNLLTPKNPLATTNPWFTRAICKILLDRGAGVYVGDSPAFGSAKRVAERTGLKAALRGLPVDVTELREPVPVPLPCGIRVGVSRIALEADLILNVPKLKAHCQVLVTAATKNLFGTVVGFRKALLHWKHGGNQELFLSILLDLPGVLPPVVSMVDAIDIMHKDGPGKGEHGHLGFLGVSDNPVAMDTAVYSILGLNVEDVPLWKSAKDKGLAGSRFSDLSFPVLTPGDIDATSFIPPQELRPLRFQILRFIKGRTRSLLMRMGITS